MMDVASTPKDAVLLLAYGGPEKIAQVREFMCELIGEEPSDELCTRIERRYLAIGGGSPLPELARTLAADLAEQLNLLNLDLIVDTAFRYTKPSIGDTVRRMYDAGVRRIIAVSLSPFESKTTTEAYRAELEEAAEGLEGLEVVGAPLISMLRQYVDAHVGGLATALHELPRESDPKVPVVFTAHSLPLADLEDPANDPYVSGVRNVAEAAANLLGLAQGSEFSDDPALPGISSYGSLSGERPWLIAYQSKGKRGGEWLGPDLGDVIDAIVASQYEGVAISPIGFALEHLETLYDLDIEAADRLLEADLLFARGGVPNNDPELVVGIAMMIASYIQGNSMAATADED